MAQRSSGSLAQGIKEYFLPLKKDSRNEKLRKIIFLFSVIVFIVSLVQLGLFLKDKGTEEGYLKEMQELAPTLADAPAQPAQPSAQQNGSAAAPAPEVRELQPWANKLLGKNKDVVGWLSIPTHTDSKGDPFINTAVVKGKDNKEYLYLNLDKKYSISGTLFADSRCTLEKDKTSDNVTIYGHHMGYIGTGLTHIHEYKQGVDFLKKNPVIVFNSLYDSTNQKYAIVGCFISNITEASDNGTLFRYWGAADFSNKDTDFNEWITEVRKRSWYSSNINCTEKDKYITLSTCSDECFGIRWVIVAKKLTAQDDLDKIVDSYKAKADGDIYFPAVWKNKLGNKKVYYGWDF